MTAALRAVVDEARERASGADPLAPADEALFEAAELRLAGAALTSLTPVINATGIVIHTNLGRAPLANEALAAVEAVAAYGNVELDLATGRRSSRHDHLDRLITETTGAETGLAVNNCAGAVLLALAALADGAPVIVSRGELVEIGGGIRVPDVVAQSGSTLVEVGTTNRTHLHDYERALREHPGARVILRTHPSNFRITGFTSAPRLEALAELASAHGVLLVEDLGGGALVDLSRFGIAGEPTVQASLRAGVDVVLFSGDKLLGGPQAGLVAGRRELVERIGRHPLARALRIDKLSLAALGATLRLYASPADPLSRVPVLRMLTEPVSVVRERAEALLEAIAGSAAQAEIVAATAYAGGGAMPMNPLPSHALALAVEGTSADELARRLRTGRPAVLGRIAQDRVLLDLRTVRDEELPALAGAVRQAL